MGAAAAQLAIELGGEVTVLDVVDVDYPTKRSLHVDLADRESVDGALAELDGRYDAIFSCAGIADGPPLMKINFISQRHIIDTMAADGRITRGSAVAMISSIGGGGWQAQMPQALEFLATGTWEEMERWVDRHEGTNSYVFSKMAMNTYVASRAFEFAVQGMRINAIMPGGTDTPLARKNADTWLPFQGDYREATGRPHLTPEQMGNTLAFLCMDAASGINGTTVVVDDGYVSSALTGTFESPILKMMLGL
ncbi:MAG: SDR family oxidoreductase [Acidimicrobiia bacterium]